MSTYKNIEWIEIEYLGSSGEHEYDAIIHSGDGLLEGIGTFRHGELVNVSDVTRRLV